MYDQLVSSGVASSTGTRTVPVTSPTNAAQQIGDDWSQFGTGNQSGLGHTGQVVGSSSTMPPAVSKVDEPESVPTGTTASAQSSAPVSQTHEPLDAYRTTIRQLYVKDNRTLDEVINIMRLDHGVHASYEHSPSLAVSF